MGEAFDAACAELKDDELSKLVREDDRQADYLSRQKGRARSDASTQLRTYRPRPRSQL